MADAGYSLSQVVLCRVSMVPRVASGLEPRTLFPCRRSPSGTVYFVALGGKHFEFVSLDGLGIYGSCVSVHGS